MRMILAVIAALVIGVGPQAGGAADGGFDTLRPVVQSNTPTFAPHLRGFFVPAV